MRATAKNIAKAIRFLLEQAIVSPLLPRAYRAEYEFFSKIRSRKYGDAAYRGAILRSRVHQIDKTLTLESPKKMDRSVADIKDLIQNDAVLSDMDRATIQWARHVLEEYDHRIQGGPPACGGFHRQFSREDAEVLLQIIRERRSIRRFASEAISDTDLRTILEAGLWAPTGCNRQTIEYLLLKGKDDIRFCQEIAGEPNTFPTESPVCIVVLVDPRAYALPGQRHMAYLEAGAAIENALLVARSLGIGSCWLFWQDAHMRHKEFIQRFGLKPWLLPVAMVCLGYPAAVPRFPPDRKELDAFIHSKEPTDFGARIE